MSLDDDRLAKASRLLRREKSLRQEDLAERGRSVYATHLIESGRAGALPLDELRAHFTELGASVRATVWWNGAALDRLIDAHHASLVEVLVSVLRQLGWEVRTEVSYSEYGERGSIDVFAANAAAQAVFAAEAKSEWGSIEETLRIQDVKTRLAPVIGKRVFGFRPRLIGSALVFSDERTARRIVDRYSGTLESSYPARSRAVRAWLGRPTGSLRGVWFLSVPRTDTGDKRR